MKTKLETCKQSRLTKSRVERFISDFHLFTSDFEVKVLTNDDGQYIEILCSGYHPTLKYLCEMFLDEFGANLHVTYNVANKLEFWFVIYIRNNHE